MCKLIPSKALAALTFLALWNIQRGLAVPPTLNCSHLEGERLIESEVKLERAGTWVTITSAKRTPDSWTYKILYEHPAIGYRAVRAGKSSATGQLLDVEYGGELFLTTQKGETRLLITAVHVERSEVSSQLLSCRGAP
jgi:hypothetical protein